MRTLAVVALLALSACPPDPNFSKAFLTVFFTNEDGQQLAASPGTALRLRNLPADCKPLDLIELQNFGPVPANFDVTPPSPQFSYRTGPFELAPGGRMSLTVTIDPTVDLPGDGRLRHEFRLDGVDEKTMDPHVFTLAASVLTPELTPAPDFGAVVIGETGSLPFVGDDLLAGDFSASGDTVFFSPSRVGLQTHQVVLQRRTECAPVRVTIRGNGVASKLVEVPDEVDFGIVSVGPTHERELVVSAWTNDLVRFANTNSAFTIDPIPTSSTPAARDTQGVLQPARHVFTVRFKAPAPGPYTGRIDIVLGTEVTSIPVRGSGNA